MDLRHAALDFTTSGTTEQATRSRRSGTARRVPMTQRIVASSVVAAMVLAAPASARAQVSDIERQEAQTRFTEGLQNARAGDFEAARRSFIEAYDVCAPSSMPSASTSGT
jgi:hypothetical protein